MGILLSRFYDKPSTRDTLERIEQQIQNIEERKWDKIKREQFIVQILSFLPLTILIANVCIFIYPSDSTWRDKFILSMPIAIFNLALYACKRIVQWYSKWSVLNEETRLRKLQKEKKRILEMVCETESYRVAAELLEKYDPKQLRRRETKEQEPRQVTSPKANKSLTKISASPLRSPTAHQQQQQMIHQQQQQQLAHQQIMHNSMIFHNQSLSLPSQPIPVPASIPAPPPPTPITKSTTTKAQLNSSVSSVLSSTIQGRPVRPILNRDRSFIEKVVDWVVADGPDNRFALICRFCYGHNGMSLAEEFETINFRCCYCNNLNTAVNKVQVHDQLQGEREKDAKSDSTKTTTTTSETAAPAATDKTSTNGTEKEEEEEEEEDEPEERPPAAVPSRNDANKTNDSKRDKKDNKEV